MSCKTLKKNEISKNWRGGGGGLFFFKFQNYFCLSEITTRCVCENSCFLVLWFKLPCSFGWGTFATRKAGHADRVTFCLLFEILLPQKKHIALNSFFLSSQKLEREGMINKKLF